MQDGEMGKRQSAYFVLTAAVIQLSAVSAVFFLIIMSTDNVKVPKYLH